MRADIERVRSRSAPQARRLSCPEQGRRPTPRAARASLRRSREVGPLPALSHDRTPPGGSGTALAAQRGKDVAEILGRFVGEGLGAVVAAHDPCDGEPAVSAEALREVGHVITGSWSPRESRLKSPRASMRSPSHVARSRVAWCTARYPARPRRARGHDRALAGPPELLVVADALMVAGYQYQVRWAPVAGM